MKDLMKNFGHIFLFLVILSADNTFSQRKETFSLGDAYRSGKIRLVQEMVIDESSLPRDVLFVGISDIAFDPTGNIYILDFQDNNIKKFDSAGKFLQVIGRKGQGPGEFNMPVSVDFARDRIVVWDMGNMRICTLTPEGDTVITRDISGLSGRPKRLRALPDGNIVVETEKIYFEDPKRPQDVHLEVLFPDLKPKKVIHSHPVWRNRYIRTEQFGWSNIPQPFSPDVHWDVAKNGKIIIGFSEKYEIGIYNGEGELLGKFMHSCQPVKVTEKEKRKFFDDMVFSGPSGIKRGAPDFIVKNTEFPKFKPSYDELLVDSEGNILVKTFLENEGKATKSFDAFDRHGKFLGRVEVVRQKVSIFERGTRWHAGSIWIKETDAQGMTKIVKYRIEKGE